ncbi:hypothetical protein RYB20_18540, partial [Pseudomonas syringae pv. actinidifoliorum]|nr:hypothetical protein [Pseudomonas syringae pv. actinidifoliorum]
TKSGRKRSRDFAYFDPSKSLAEGRKDALTREHIQLTSPNRCVTRSATKRTQSVQNCMPTRSIGTIIIIADECGSGLVREKAGIIAENASYEIPSS